MRLTAITLAILTASGCAATTSALGALTGSKPNQVTVLTSVAPPSVVVNVAPPPAPVAVARSAPSTLQAAATGAVAGAVLGTVVGYAVAGPRGAGEGAAMGGGAGAVTGWLVHETERP